MYKCLSFPRKITFNSPGDNWPTLCSPPLKLVPFSIFDLFLRCIQVICSFLLEVSFSHGPNNRCHCRRPNQNNACVLESNVHHFQPQRLGYGCKFIFKAYLYSFYPLFSGSYLLNVFIFIMVRICRPTV